MKRNSLSLHFSYYVLFVGAFLTRKAPLSYLLVEQGITSSFGTVNQDTGWTSNGYSNVQKSPIYTTLSGHFFGGSFDLQASYGHLWSGTTNSGTNAYGLIYNSSNVYPAYNHNRQHGFPVRRIAQKYLNLIIKTDFTFVSISILWFKAPIANANSRFFRV